MANAGVLTVKITTEQAQFSRGVLEAKNSLGGFGDTVKSGGKHMEGFNMHTLTSRGNLRLLGEAAGATLTPLHYMVGALTSLGAVGVGIAGAFLVKEEIDLETERLKKLATGWKEVGESHDRTFKLMGFERKLSPHAEDAKKAMAETSATIRDLQNQINFPSFWEKLNLPIGADARARHFTQQYRQIKELTVDLVRQQNELNKAMNAPMSYGAHGSSIGGLAAQAYAAEHSAHFAAMIAPAPPKPPIVAAPEIKAAPQAAQQAISPAYKIDGPTGNILHTLQRIYEVLAQINRKPTGATN